MVSDDHQQKGIWKKPKTRDSWHFKVAEWDPFSSDCKFPGILPRFQTKLPGDDAGKLALSSHLTVKKNVVFLFVAGNPMESTNRILRMCPAG